MNDEDIQLITSLIGSELSEADESIAFNRIAADPELRAAYDEQLAIASLLETAPEASMTAAERDTLHTALRTELLLDDAVVAVAPAPSRWSRWWAPVSGLAAAAVVVFAVAVVPNLLDGTDSADLVSAPAFQDTETTTGSELAPAAEDGAEEDYRGLAGEAEPSTAPAAGESADSLLRSYFVAPGTAAKGEIELPVAELESLNEANLDPALARSRQLTTVDVATFSACFDNEATGIPLEPVAVTPDGASVYAIATDEALEDTVVLVNLLTCEVTTAD